MIFKRKKAELSDMFIWLITLSILAIGLFILMFIVLSITDGLRYSGLNNSAEGISAINSLDYFSTNTINNGFLMLFFGLSLSVLISSFLVRTHPIFLFLYIIFLGITLLLSFYLGNAYHQMIDNPVFAGVIDPGVFSTLVFENIAEITIGVGALSMIILFAKFSSFGGSQQF